MRSRNENDKALRIPFFFRPRWWQARWCALRKDKWQPFCDRPEEIMHLSAAIPGGLPGGLTPGNPRAFAPRYLQIPPTQGQYSSTKSYHCPSSGEHNLEGLPN